MVQYRKARSWRSHAREGDVAGAALLRVVVNASAAMSGRSLLGCAHECRKPPAPE
jgi:hypothetical protein